MNTLSVDIGGTFIKAALLNAAAQLLNDRTVVATPRRLHPHRLVELVGGIGDRYARFGRVSVGFPGAVRDGSIVTAPNLGTRRFAGFDLEDALAERLGKPVRVINDADMQGLGAIVGNGVEMVITLGTGFGTALFQNGWLAPHLEIAHQCFRNGETYEQELGDEGRRSVGRRRWNERLARAIESLRSLTNFDHLYIGGGNTTHVQLALPADVTIVDSMAALVGGIRLWRAPVTPARSSYWSRRAKAMKSV